LATALSQYLDSIRDNLKLDPVSEGEIVNELKTHVEDRVQELKEAGLSEEEAVKNCVGLLGPAKLVARQIYEAHSQGTWRQALLASTPHLLFGLLFALNWWQGIGWLSIVLVLVIGTAVYGWSHGKPAWFFPWLGCSLLLVGGAGLLLLYLPKVWSWLVIPLYIPLALWLLYSITIQTIKRDWLYSSLMLLPVPTVIGWFLIVTTGGEFPEYSLESLQYFAPWVGLAFLALAVSMAVFIRVRQRRSKTAVLVISGLLTLTMVAYFANGRLGLPAFFVLILALVSLFIVPALLERRIRRKKQQLVT